MKRIAIVGGGISGLAAAYELEQQRRNGASVEWELFEASGRLGGLLSTTRVEMPSGRFVMEDGPDGWVTEKPWARELAEELGLGGEVIACNEERRRTLVLVGERMEAMPQRMRMMVPEDLDALQGSSFFTDDAIAAYAQELESAEALKASAPGKDESVASFVERHFGHEVLEKIGAPLLGGVFGGDAYKLSVRAVMPQFVKMEQEHGSLIVALQTRSRERGERKPQPAFQSLKDGMGSLMEAIVARLPMSRVHLNSPVADVFRDKHDESKWHFTYDAPDVRKSDGTKFLWDGEFEHLILATPVDIARSLLPGAAHDLRLDRQLPTDASSAVLVAMGWEREAAKSIHVPEGFGFLVPVGSTETTLLATTFVDQKYPYRAPEGGRILRAFFGGSHAEAMLSASDEEIVTAAHTQLSRILGPLPAPEAALTTVRRWPRSLPQYEVSHLERMAQLDELVARIGNLTLLGNSYRGVGVPDLIRDARAAALKIAEE
jgi:oxygen-dependent protoporphyrinogen oxidase